MASRAYWKGHLRLSLVTVGIELFSAVKSSESMALHQIHKPSGKRIRYQKVAPGIGEVDASDIIKGYEVEKNEYVTLDDDELDAIKLESKRTIDLVQFVDHDEIDPRYFEKPYYVVPGADDVAHEGFAVIREALRKAKKVGLGQMATRGKDQMCAVRPCGEGILLETLRYEKEVKDSDDVFHAIPKTRVDKEMLSLAEELIGRKTAKFHPEKFKSHYKAALKELIEDKRKHGKITSADDEELEEGSNVIDLMDALRKSVSGKGKAVVAHAAKSSARKSSARKTPAKRKAPAKKTAHKAHPKRKAG
ncbi:MAG TPA: Ku protein [Hyphomonadaceae bacterium]|jgi:DNA end-binding protein Ku|nr:Ku protein [Hyphomonadaceae bacterium]